MHRTKLESASIQFKGEDKVIWSWLKQQACILEPLDIFIMVFSSRPPKKRKEIKLFTRESYQQAKEESKNLFGFSLIITIIDMESKLTNFFGFFLRFIKHTRRKLEKEIQLAWIVQ